MFSERAIENGLTSPLLLVFGGLLLVAAWSLLADWHGASGRLIARLQRLEGAPVRSPLKSLPPDRRGVRILAVCFGACGLLCIAAAVKLG